MFSREVCEIFKNNFFSQHLRWLLLHLRWLLLHFFKKWLNSYFAALLWHFNIFFFSTYSLMYKKSNSFVYKFVVNRQGVPYKTEYWHTWSHEQYFSKNHFLDICQYAFNEEIKIVSNFFWIVSKCESVDHITKVENFHIVLKLLRITSWCLGFINNLKSKISKKGVNKHNYIIQQNCMNPNFYG